MSDTSPLEISVSEAHAALTGNGDKDPVLLDVRESDEWAHVHVDSARHVPMNQVPERLAEIPKDRPVLVMCHHGGRSLRVTRFLREKGYDNAQNIKGGIDAWAREIDTSLPRY